MSNIIDKIQLSGVTYDIGGQGGSGVSVVEVTQAGYDALPTSAKTDTSKMYVITDAEAGDLTNYYTKTETDTLLSGKADTATTYTKSEVDNAITAATATKQDTLVSGTNIKTINNESILGSGNIDIQGGGGTDAPISAGTGTDSVKENYVNNVASGEYSHAEGRSTSASGNSSHAEGNGTSAKGNYAHAEGHQTSASGSSSHAEGELTNANGSNSHAEGSNTKANGSDSHAEGKYSQASGQTSHAEGDNTRANGTKSHAEGGSTVANGSNSHAEGDNTVANNESEHASGKYNVSNTGETASAQTLFSVGNGGWDETAQDVVRHNAFEIRQNGDIYLSSGGTDIKLQDHLGGGGGSSYTAGDGIDITNNVISVTGKVDTTTYNTYTAATDAALATKQTTLTAGTNITIVDNVISATGGGGGGVTIDPTLDSGSTNPVANSAITEAVLVPSYRGLIEVQNDIAFPNATALYVENVTGGTYQDATMILFYLSGVSEVNENILVTSFSGHTLNNEPFYMNYEWTEDNSLIFTPKTSGNYFYKILNGWDTGFGVYIIDDYSSGSSSSVIQNEIYPRLNNLTEKVDSFDDTKVTGVAYSNLYNDYGGYWYHEINIYDNHGGRFATQDQLRYDDFGYDNGVITVKKTSGVTSGSTDCITSGGVYEQMGGMKIVKLTQSAYDALSPNYDSNTLYVIVN